jgi:hypothetical protein
MSRFSKSSKKDNDSGRGGRSGDIDLNDLDDLGIIEERMEELLSGKVDIETVTRSLQPEIEKKLYPYQVMHVLTLLSVVLKNGCALDGSETGTGKTFCAMALAAALGLKAVVVCPLIMMSYWRDIAGHFGVQFVAINYETLRRGKMYDGAKRVPCPFLKLDEITGKFEWSIGSDTIIIFDEAHVCQNRHSLNGRLLLATRGFKTLLVSATIADTEEKFHVFGVVLKCYKDLRAATSWVSWARRNKILNKELYPAHGSRMRIRDLVGVFPQNQISVEIYSLDAATLAQIDKMWLRLLKENKKEKPDAGKVQKLRMAIELAKMPIFEQLARADEENGCSVANFVIYRKSVAALSDALGTSCIIQGNQSEADRNEAIRSFQADEDHHIVCNIRAGGVGIGLHDTRGERKRISQISPGHSSRDLKQALGRIFRAGAKTACLQRIIFADTPIERHLAECVRAKLGFMDQLNDGDLSEVSKAFMKQYKKNMEKAASG